MKKSVAQLGFSAQVIIGFVLVYFTVFSWKAIVVLIFGFDAFACSAAIILLPFFNRLNIGLYSFSGVLDLQIVQKCKNVVKRQRTSIKSTSFNLRLSFRFSFSSSWNFRRRKLESREKPASLNDFQSCTDSSFLKYILLS